MNYLIGLFVIILLQIMSTCVFHYGQKYKLEDFLRVLSTLYCCQENISSDGSPKLAFALKDNTKIKKFYLNGNGTWPCGRRNPYAHEEIDTLVDLMTHTQKR